MIEFAIVLLLLTLLTAGGIELVSAALAGWRLSEAGRSGAEHWLVAVGSAGIYDNAGGASFAITASPFDEGGTDAVGLGDHLTGAFTRPACGADEGDYDDGLPADSVTRGGSAIYLFNPLPIDATACTGSDATDPAGRSRLALLVAALPPLNRALYPLYQLRCLDGDGVETDCGGPAEASRLYRLPGRHDPVDDTVSLAVLDGDPDSPTFQMPLADSPRPTFELDCVAPGRGAQDPWEPCDTAATPEDVCWSAADATPLACDLRLRVRYRHLFYSFLQFPFVYWQDPLPPEALAQLDLGPGGQGGVLGAEVGLGNVRLFQRTFLACYETVTVAPTAGMSGRRSLRAC